MWGAAVHLQGWLSKGSPELWTWRQQTARDQFSTAIPCGSGLIRLFNSVSTWLLEPGQILMHWVVVPVLGHLGEGERRKTLRVEGCIAPWLGGWTLDSDCSGSSFCSAACLAWPHGLQTCTASPEPALNRHHAGLNACCLESLNNFKKSVSHILFYFFNWGIVDL